MGIVKGLKARGWDVVLWYPSGHRRQRGAARRLVESIKTQARLVFRRERPKVLYVRGHFAALPTVVWARLRRVPVVVEVNGPATDVLSSWPWARPILPLLRASATLQLRMSTVAIAVTPELCRASLEAGARRCHVVSNGADVELFSPSATTTRVLPRPYACFAGTLATWQGIDSLLAAMDRPEWPTGVSLVVIGDGALERTVRARSAIDQRVSYLGRLPPTEIGGILAGSVCAVIPKKKDHAHTGVVPLKLFEAMAAGVPVVVTSLSGQADIVTAHGCGLVVGPDDPAAIATAIGTLVLDPSVGLEMGRRGRAAAVSRYSWDASAAQTDEILGGLAVG